MFFFAQELFIVHLSLSNSPKQKHSLLWWEKTERFEQKYELLVHISKFICKQTDIHEKIIFS